MICSRGTIPNCVVCGEPTMEAGADDEPHSKSWDGDGWLCSEACEMREVLASASPDVERYLILRAAEALGNLGDLIPVRVHRPGCTPVEGVVLDVGKFDVKLEECSTGAEVVCLLGMVSKCEVIE